MENKEKDLRIGEIIVFPKENGIGVIDENKQILECKDEFQAKVLSLLFSLHAKINLLEKKEK